MIENEIYVSIDTNNIFMWGTINSKYYFGNTKGSPPNQNFSKGSGGFRNTKYRLANQKEKQWLLACIAANKFIPLNQIKLNKIYSLY